MFYAFGSTIAYQSEIERCKMQCHPRVASCQFAENQVNDGLSEATGRADADPKHCKQVNISIFPEPSFMNESDNCIFSQSREIGEEVA